MKKKGIYLTSLLCFILIACQKENTQVDINLDSQLDELLDIMSNNQGRAFFILPDSDDYGKIPTDPKNPINPEKVNLGKLLFHETGLSINPHNLISKNTYSCASCHFAGAGFQSGLAQGIADGGIGFGNNGEGRMKGSLYRGDEIDVCKIRTPTVLNVTYQEVVFWSGLFGGVGMNEDTKSSWVAGPAEANHLGFEGTETQAIAGLIGHRLGVEDAFLEKYGYKPLFDAAFPHEAQESRYDGISAGLAIAAYERTILANQAPFQKWLKGASNAMTQQQKEGAILFFGKAECATCHTGPALNKMDFEAIGLKDMAQSGHPTFNVSINDNERLGRGGFTGNTADNYKFKIPQLYNLKDSPFYGHGSSFSTIQDIIAYKNTGTKENGNVPDQYLSPDFKPLGLTEGEIQSITEFITNGLYDDNLERYTPNSILSGYCFPFNDPLARNQMGCD